METNGEFYAEVIGSDDLIIIEDKTTTDVGEALVGLKEDLNDLLTSPLADCDSSTADETVKQFVKVIKNYIRTHSEAFILLCEADKYLAAHHYLRLMSDLYIQLYGAQLKKEKGTLLEYIDQFLAGKDTRNIRYGKGYLTTEVIKKEMKKTGYDWVLALYQKEGNKSAHMSSFYMREDKEVTQAEKIQIIYPYHMFVNVISGMIHELLFSE
jgi:hypothetical protein